MIFILLIEKQPKQSILDPKTIRSVLILRPKHSTDDYNTNYLPETEIQCFFWPSKP
jgi:hypothetical protein